MENKKFHIILYEFRRNCQTHIQKFYLYIVLQFFGLLKSDLGHFVSGILTKMFHRSTSDIAVLSIVENKPKILTEVMPKC